LFYKKESHFVLAFMRKIGAVVSLLDPPDQLHDALRAILTHR